MSRRTKGNGRTDRHRECGPKDPKKLERGRGRLEIVLVAGSLIDKQGQFIQPILKKKRTVNVAPIDPATKRRGRPKSGEYLDPFHFDGYHATIKALHIHLSRRRDKKQLSSAKNELCLQISPREGHRSAKNDPEYHFRLYTFSKLRPGHYVIHVRTTRSHQCFPDVRGDVYVGHRSPTRVVVVLSTDTIGDIAHTKGIYVGAQGAERLRPDTTIPEMTPDEKASYRREFNAQTLYTGPSKILKSDGSAGPEIQWPWLHWFPNDPKPWFDDQPALRPTFSDVRPLYPVLANALLWLYESDDPLHPGVDWRNDSSLLAQHDSRNLIRSYISDALASFAKQYSADKNPKGPAYFRQVVAFNEPLRAKLTTSKIEGLKRYANSSQYVSKYIMPVADISYIYAAFQGALEGAKKALQEEANTHADIQRAPTRLYLNEKQAELTNKKQQCLRYRRLIRTLVAKQHELVATKDITLAIGIQGHFRRNQICGKSAPGLRSDKKIEKKVTDFRSNMHKLAGRFGGRKLPIALTEMAVGYKEMYPTTPGQKMKPSHKIEQKKVFYKLLSAFFAYENCDELMFWNFNDRVHEHKDKGKKFNGDRFGLLFDEGNCKAFPFHALAPGSNPMTITQLGRKPAYFGVLQALIEARSRP